MIEKISIFAKKKAVTNGLFIENNFLNIDLWLK